MPSSLVYDAEGNVKAWGYDVAGGDDEIVIECFKLAIVPEKDLPPNLRNSEKLKEIKTKMRHLNLDAGQVMAHYIEKIWTHAQDEIRKSVGRRDFNSMPIHVVITIPATWGNEAIQTIEYAAACSIFRSGNAGLTTHEFLPEPEQALQAYARDLQLKLDVGDVVMVMDLGGGTGDVKSYKKAGEGDDDSLGLREAVPGYGRRIV